MDAKVGDRVSLDAKKVGQARRTGLIRSVTQGLAGVRYLIRWDDGSESTIAPGAGVLLVEGKAKAKKATKPKTKAPVKKKAKAKAQAKRTKRR